ncbi:MAG: HD domain-containing protein [Chloroflexota bacterium]
MASEAQSFDGLIQVLSAAGVLKRVKRAGWVRVGLPQPESVADHSYRVALLAVLFGPRLGLDVERMTRLALLHDLAEARVGDLTPADGIGGSEKHAWERAAFAEIVAGLPEARSLDDLWREYETGASPEARAVHQLDKLELALQTLEYERASASERESGRRRSRRRPTAARPRPAVAWADEFWESARAALTDPLLIALYEELRRRRPMSISGGH